MIHRRVLIRATLAALTAWVMPAVAVPPEWPDGALIEGQPLRPVLPADAIPAIDAPVHVSAAEASFFDGGEPVIGVVVNGEARAYSLAQLDWHEVVNDELGGATDRRHLVTGGPRGRRVRSPASRRSGGRLRRVGAALAPGPGALRPPDPDSLEPGGTPGDRRTPCRPRTRKNRLGDHRMGGLAPASSGVDRPGAAAGGRLGTPRSRVGRPGNLDRGSGMAPRPAAGSFATVNEAAMQKATAERPERCSNAAARAGAVSSVSRFVQMGPCRFGGEDLVKAQGLGKSLELVLVEHPPDHVFLGRCVDLGPPGELVDPLSRHDPAGLGEDGRALRSPPWRGPGSRGAGPRGRCPVDDLAADRAPQRGSPAARAASMRGRRPAVGGRPGGRGRSALRREGAEIEGGIVQTSQAPCRRNRAGDHGRGGRTGRRPPTPGSFPAPGAGWRVRQDRR